MAGQITHKWNGTILTITSDSGTSSCDLKGQQGDIGIRGPQGIPGEGVGIPGKDGEPGKDGVGVANIYQKTTSLADGGENVYVIELTDGTISNFKVRNGNKGKDGETPSLDGYATEQYVDDIIANLDISGVNIDLSNYYTKSETDAALTGLATQEYVSNAIETIPATDLTNYYTKIETDAAIAAKEVDLSAYVKTVNNTQPDANGNVAIAATVEPPIFVSSETECVDETKMYLLPDGFIYAYMAKTSEDIQVPAFTNVMEDATAYIKDGERYSHSSGAFTTSNATNECALVFPVPSAGGEISVLIRGTSIKVSKYYNTSTYFGMNNQTLSGTGTAFKSTITTKDNGDIEITASYPEGYCYMVQHVDVGTKKEDLIITVNEPIKYTTIPGGTTYELTNTGHAFIPADYEGRIIAVENAAASNTAKITALENKPATGGVFTMFISPLGDDANNGLTASTPKKTVKACVEAGATRISAKRGVYAENLKLLNISTLEIFPTDNDKTYVAGETRDAIVFDTADRIDVSAFSAYNSIKRAAYNNAANAAYNQVFTLQTLEPIVSGSQSSYRATAWLLSEDEKTVCIKLKPVLTVAECEAGANTVCYNGGYIYINADITGITNVIVPTNVENGIYINGADKIVLREVEVRFSGEYNYDLRECAWVELYKCASKYTTRASGFHPVNTNGVFKACYATKCFDGFAPNGHGHTTYIDCVSENNFDDGMSHHAGTEGTVIGGRYEGNGKGGNIPAYGAKVNIYGGLYKNNKQFGICYAGDGVGNYACGMVQGAAMVDNPVGLEVQAECIVSAIGCHYTGNTKDKKVNAGTLTEY